MDTNKILFLCPLSGNGGIASWAKSLLKAFDNKEYQLCPINIAPPNNFSEYNTFERIINGVLSFVRIRKDVKSIIKTDPQIQLLHNASGGGLGILRDYFIGKLLAKHHYKMILHCHFGNVPELLINKGWKGLFFRKAVALYTQVWVLDQRSVKALSNNPNWAKKIFLTPNPIDVPESCPLIPKEYSKVGFVGNLIPTKGIYELTEAISHQSSSELFIVGQGQQKVIEKIKHIAGGLLDKRIHLLGLVPNPEAVKLIESLDIICLPTYYPGEAFPISILEAMSRGKLVVSCPRAAIPDILTSLDGSMCGILVPERNVEAIEQAVLWCQKNKTIADEMCDKAYKKVRGCYSKEVVHNLYCKNYRALINETHE